MAQFTKNLRKEDEGRRATNRNAHDNLQPFTYFEKYFTGKLEILRCCVQSVRSNVVFEAVAFVPDSVMEEVSTWTSAHKENGECQIYVVSFFEGASSLGLGCNMRLYTYRITQSDSKGRECWDHVSVWSCFGRCDSNEISDWKFPYKRSYHPVCMHAGRSKAVAMLRNCHPQASPETRRYEYMEAIGCHCQV